MRLLLDEMFPAAVAAGLRERGYDVVAVQEDSELWSLGDSRLFTVAQVHRRALVTENVEHFVPIVMRLMRVGHQHHGLICTTNRSHPRHGRFVGKLMRDLADLLDRHPDDRPHGLVLWL